MELKILSNQSISIEEYNVSCVIVGLAKSYMILVTDQDQFGIGQIFFSSPGLFYESDSISSTTPILGIGESIIDKIIADYCVKKLNHPCLVMVNVKSKKFEKQFIVKAIMSVLNKCIDEILNSK